MPSLPELLAPAGNFECAQTAFMHGADAVYVGIGPFNLRAHFPNFSVEEMPDLLAMARERGKRVYGVFNAMPDDSMLDMMRSAAQGLAARGILPDALIVSDPGVIAMCRSVLPGVRIHLSTQTGTFNSGALEFWRAQGVSRVIAPRECTLTDVTSLARGNILEVEVFIHGAMCVSISGRCLLGAYLAGRHPNRGDCPQPCRVPYRIAPIDGSETPEYLTVEESQNRAYLLNSKDLCTIDILPAIVTTGVCSLKIEGRNKSAHYVATVVKAYREALESLRDPSVVYKVEERWRTELDRIEHRPYTTGFYDGAMNLQEVFTSKASTGFRVVGVVKAMLAGGLPVIDVKNTFRAGDPLNILPVQQKLPSYDSTFSSLTELSGAPVTKALPNRLVVGLGAGRLHSGDMIRRAG